MKILYVAYLQDGTQGWQRLNALKDLGHEVYSIDRMPEFAIKLTRTLPVRILQKIIGPIDWIGLNKKVLATAESEKIDVLWLSKALTIKHKTLRNLKQKLPNCKILGYSADDQMNPNNQSRQWLKSLPIYDIFFTTKSYNVSELEDIGCRAVYIGKSFDPQVHRPIALSEEDKKEFGGPVGFIGSYERERAGSMTKLALSGIGVRIWGGGWNKNSALPSNIRCEHRQLFGDDYARAICAFDINLCFLRKVNRDLQTSRSIEIPACKGFMLAERTSEHLELYDEGKEADFFGSDEELMSKVRFYLKRPELRKKIAEAGYQRCLKSGWTQRDRLSECLSHIKMTK